MEQPKRTCFPSTLALNGAAVSGNAQQQDQTRPGSKSAQHHDAKTVCRQCQQAVSRHDRQTPCHFTSVWRITRASVRVTLCRDRSDLVWVGFAWQQALRQATHARALRWFAANNGRRMTREARAGQTLLSYLELSASSLRGQGGRGEGGGALRIKRVAVSERNPRGRSGRVSSMRPRSCASLAWDDSWGDPGCSNNFLFCALMPLFY